MYTFDRVSVCLESREVFLGAQRQTLSTRAFDILELLINAGGRLVTKDEIMRVVWPRTFVVDNNIHVHVCELRKLFGGRRGWIRTDSGRGYRLTPPEPRQPRSAPLASASPGALVGRERELKELHTLIDSEVLLTLVGAPGVGKSGLARELARERASSRDIPTLFIELAESAPGTSVVSALGEALALPQPHNRAAIIAAIIQRPALIVLDGCDPFIDEVSSLCQALATFGADIRLVATSREPLRISAERVWKVPPLATPAATASDSEVATSPAVRLFLQRLGEHTEDTSLDALNRDMNMLNVVASLCRRAGGNPLALELVATRAATLGVLGLLELSDEQWVDLGNATWDAPRRHRSLAAAYAWSCGRLAPDEQSILSRLAALPNSFTLDAVCAIAIRCSLDNERMLYAFVSLVSKSLIEVETSPHAGVRHYRLSNTLRAYIRGLLATAASEAGKANHAVAVVDVNVIVDADDEPLLDSSRTLNSAATWSADQAAITDAKTVPSAGSRRDRQPSQRSTSVADPDPCIGFPVETSATFSRASPGRPALNVPHPLREHAGVIERVDRVRSAICYVRAKSATRHRLPRIFCLWQGKRRTRQKHT
ncbi:winged helix-turn-helix domain-containing protein [Paraburkholderia bannensis]|uniref:winged helix-turn-helix domain-containing protein n=1 Tax=Paraburkholderia bannensis TaxID=765414 RepID=UPI002AB79541|nr:winged helix-turn-helix domain-containing protein [Paraburkholderia bannensis]